MAVDVTALSATLPEYRKTFYKDIDGVYSAVKDSESVELFYVDWADVLVGSESISASFWEYSGVSGAGEISFGGLTGATISGADGTAKNTVTTNAGRTLVRRLRFVEVSV